VVEDSVDLRDVVLINGAGGQSGSGPSWEIVFLFAPFSLSLRDPSLNLVEKNTLIFLVARVGVWRGPPQGPVERSSREKVQGCRRGERWR